MNDHLLTHRTPVRYGSPLGDCAKRTGPVVTAIQLLATIDGPQAYEHSLRRWSQRACGDRSADRLRGGIRCAFISEC